jgi:hypothetical protein
MQRIATGVLTVLVLLIASEQGLAQPVASAKPRPPQAARQYPRVAAHEIARLDAALSALAERNESTPLGGLGTILTGGLLVAGGVYFALEDPDSKDRGEQWLHGGVSGLLLALGGASVVLGVGALGSESIDAQRLVSFRATAARGGMDVVAFARFEGALISEWQIARANRVTGGFASLGVAAGGAGGIALALAAQDAGDSTRTSVGVLGGIYLLYGLWQGIAALTTESEVEAIVRRYTERPASVPRPRPIALSPTVAPAGLGFTLRASF